VRLKSSVFAVLTSSTSNIGYFGAFARVNAGVVSADRYALIVLAGNQVAVALATAQGTL
jgi:hypothetical protein